MNEVGPQLPRILQLRGECQRIFYYGLIAIVVVNSVVLIFPYYFVTDGQSVNWAGCVLVSVLFSPALIIGLPRKWIVDDRGITRKTIFSDQLWTWDDFASGRVIKNGPNSWYDPARPWTRKLGFTVSHEDFTWVTGLINEHWPDPIPIILPETLSFRKTSFERITLSQNGLQYDHNNPKKSYAITWKEVSFVMFSGFEPKTRFLGSAMLVSSQRCIRISRLTAKYIQESQAGTDMFTLIHEFIKTHCAVEKIIYRDSREIIDHPAYLKLLLESRKKDRKLSRWLSFFIFAISLTGFVVIAQEDGIKRTAIGFTPFLSVVFFFSYLSYQSDRKNQCKSERTRRKA